MNDAYFKVTSKLNKEIIITKSRWKVITEIKHLEIKGKEKEIKATLLNPDEIRLSVNDSAVYLYYKYYAKLSLVAVAKHLNNGGFIITAYYTDRIKEGKQIYKRLK